VHYFISVSGNYMCFLGIYAVKKKMLKYALFDFFESKTLGVGETASIVWKEGDKPSDLNVYVLEQRVVGVMWSEIKKTKPKASKGDSEENAANNNKVYQARIIRLSGLYFMCMQAMYWFIFLSEIIYNITIPETI